MTRSVHKRLIYPVIGILVFLMAVIGGYIYLGQKLDEPIEVKDIQVDTKAALKLNVLEQISKKNGIKEWELKAASATLYRDQNKAVLENVAVKFFTKDNKEVTLTSQKGILNTKTHDMTFSDSVVVRHEGALLLTDQLHYKKKEHIIHSDTRVRLEKLDSNIEADSMTTDLNTNTIVLTGHVKGLFSENFKIR